MLNKSMFDYAMSNKRNLNQFCNRIQTDTFLIVVETSKTSKMCTIQCNYLIVTASATRTEAGQESNEANPSAETAVSHSELKVSSVPFIYSSTSVFFISNPIFELSNIAMNLLSFFWK